MQLCHEALSRLEDQLGPDHPAAGRAAGTLARLLRLAGRYAEAVEHCARAVAIFESRLGVQHPDYAGALNSLGTWRVM